jgi:PadR family transcriptional regulator, regulatory protein PadR
MDAGNRQLTQLRKGTLEYCVLALLQPRARYGFELSRLLGQVTGLHTSEGSIYPLLTRLHKVGRVGAKWQESTSGPPRRYYHLTEAGAAALTEFRREWVVFRDGVDRVLAEVDR